MPTQATEESLNESDKQAEQELKSIEQAQYQPLIALCIVARFYQIAADPKTIAHRLGITSADRIDTSLLIQAARLIGLTAKESRTTAERLKLLPLPALTYLVNERNETKIVILAQTDGQKVLYHEINADGSKPIIASLEAFVTQWTGKLILLTDQAKIDKAFGKFDFTWFVPSIIKHRRIIGEILAISFIIQLLGLVTPLFFQVIMDKVLVHKGLATLNVLIIGMLAVILFESVLNGLRSYILSHTTSRIDVELGAKLFRHLIQLPLVYFQNRRVGDSVARIRELENIRSFLTGSALTTVLDVFFSIVFIAVMMMYSVKLTLIVLASMPLYLVLSLTMMPIIHRRLDNKFARGAENQAMLVEAVTGIQTVKASALEPAFSRRWDNQLAAYVSANFKTQNSSSWANECVNFIGKAVNALTLWFGAHAVMESEMTVGQFIAFNMFAQRVSQPIIRMAQLWTNFQQTGISMERLGDILDTPTEIPPASAVQLGTIKGRVTLDNVTFRYRPQAQPVLVEVSINAMPGEIIGVVGRSGSGKSTLTKIIQRLYRPEYGRVLIDGIDIGTIDATQLRRQIGVVLQENFLFNRSVRENIAISDPAAPIERVIRAARLAGAHQFIGELEEGYDTLVGEHGHSLSGGQRQRIAIARALFTEPRILIFDEATSALDYESEDAIQRNMAQICHNRTVFIIAHRLSAVRTASRILVMDHGRVVEIGTHESLLTKPNGIYAKLWNIQAGTKDAQLDDSSVRSELATSEAG